MVCRNAVLFCKLLLMRRQGWYKMNTRTIPSQGVTLYVTRGPYKIRAVVSLPTKEKLTQMDLSVTNVQDCTIIISQ